jgi:hypothetical protein
MLALTAKQKIEETSEAKLHFSKNRPRPTRNKGA